MTSIPPATARAILLRSFPRVLRTALDGGAVHGDAAQQLITDAHALGPGLGAAVQRCLDAARGSSRLPATIPLAATCAMLDEVAALTDRPAAREVADALLMLLAPAGDRDTAARLALAVWRETGRLDEVGTALRRISLLLASGDDEELPNPYDDLLGTVGDPEVGAAFPASGAVRADAAQAWRQALGAAFDGLKKDAAVMATGLSAMAVGQVPETYVYETLAAVALKAGRQAVGPVERLAVAEERRRVAERKAAAQRRERERSLQAPAPEPEAAQAAGTEPPEGHVIVCQSAGETGHGRGKEVWRGYEHVIGTPLPLVVTPNLAEVRNRLLGEFPQAEAVIDQVLRWLVGRAYVHLGNLLIEGPPGSGKSRFARRLGETLGMGVLRVDGSNDGGASFGGTERRWHSTEPCRPFMAVARWRQANPLVFVDEVDKAPTRSDYGRLWDAMLQAMDPETAARFPDPCLQADLDLSWVSIICTANESWRLPGPLLDRFRAVLSFPEPGPEHLDALLPALVEDIARERGLDRRFFPPLDGVEREFLRRRWQGGSVRRLRRMVDAVLRVRDRVGSSTPQ
ncbi:AAA family ATPase [Microvirga soli]|uniref:AAA family ATPase n=1 Tax=Microvirga soli TaxID=1854496 RepID=UPI001FE9F20E|nr:AAA family ATPase [Microvirga soli]